MMRLDEIEKRYSNEGEIETVQIADDLGILTRAVRQLGEERQEYQKLFNAVDDLGSDRPPSLQTAFDDMCSANVPDSDVLELVTLP